MQNTTKNQLCEENDGTPCFVENFDEYPLTYFTNDTYCDAIFSKVSEHEVDEYMNVLLQREISFYSLTHKHRISAITSNSARIHAINYILHMVAMVGFQLQTAYLSLCYFDLFLSKRSIDGEKLWAIQLLSVACISVAAKLEENLVPSLSELQEGKYKFESKVIQRMELLVLETLEWKVRIVTPFAYLPCFINRLGVGSPSQGTSSTIIKFILAFFREVNLMDHHPYAIAFASILVTLNLSLTREAIELKAKTIPFSRILDMEDILTCYNIMVLLDAKTKVLSIPDSSDLSPIHVVDDIRATSTLRSKRKSLTFKVHDHNDDLCQKRQH